MDPAPGSQHLIDGSYDFSARPLLRLARRRLAAKDAESARKLLNLAVGFGMDSLLVRTTLADVALAQDDRAAAVAHLEQALTLASSADEKSWVGERLESLRSAQPPPP